MFQAIKQYFDRRKARKRIIYLARAIDAIDKALDKRVSTEARRKFWYDFIYSPDRRQKLIREALNGV